MGLVKGKAAAGLLAVSLGCVAAGPVAAKTVSSGVITVGRGASGVELGMSRAQVVQRLGKPNGENGFGTMSYGSDRSNTIFDVYRSRGGARGTVTQFLIASPRNRHFTLQDGNRVFTKGGLRRVSRRYGKRLKFHTFEDGSPYYEVVSKLRGRKVLTDFETDGHSLDAHVLDVFILYG
jgi:hypothetical protein